MTNYDVQCMKEVEEIPQACVGWLLMASWIYYSKPHMTPLLSDSCFDILCKSTLERFDKIEHRFKHLITEEDLKAGSLFSLGDYNFPRQVCYIAEDLSQKL